MRSKRVVGSLRQARKPTSEAVLWTDGAARGNPGPAGLGAILKRADGEVLARESRYLGVATNNVAEYSALLAGLETARSLGIRHLEVRADSELLIKQLRGEYQVRSQGLRPLYERARALIAEFGSVTLTHVRRELNTEADELANQGVDAASTASASKSADK